MRDHGEDYWYVLLDVRVVTKLMLVCVGRQCLSQAVLDVFVFWLVIGLCDHMSLVYDVGSSPLHGLMVLEDWLLGCYYLGDIESIMLVSSYGSRLYCFRQSVTSLNRKTEALKENFSPLMAEGG